MEPIRCLVRQCVKMSKCVKITRLIWHGVHIGNIKFYRRRAAGFSPIKIFISWGNLIKCERKRGFELLSWGGNDAEQINGKSGEFREAGRRISVELYVARPPNDRGGLPVC